MATLAEQLASVQAAIADVETNGQHIGASGNRIWTKADLKTLYDREKDLLSRTAGTSQSLFDRALVARPYRGD